MATIQAVTGRSGQTGSGLAETDTTGILADPIRRDIRQLTGLRGLAAVSVVLTHYDLNVLPVWRYVLFGNAAVDVFFCLSSFTLCLVYGAGVRPSLDLRAYGVARFARVYPLFIVTTLFVLGYSLCWQIPPIAQLSTVVIVSQLVRQASLLSELPMHFWGNLGNWNVPAWSIPVEAFCYVLAFPPLFVASSWTRRLKPGAIVMLMLILGAVSYVAFAKQFSPRLNDPNVPQLRAGIAPWVPLIRGFTSFGSGWLAYLLYLNWRDAAAFIGSITDALALGFMAIIVSESFGLVSSATVVIIAPFLILGLMDGRSWTARLLASPPVHFLGLISYSLYLWHLALRIPAWHLWPWLPDANYWHSRAFPLLLALLVSTASFYLFETPVRRWINASLGRRRLRPI